MRRQHLAAAGRREGTQNPHTQASQSVDTVNVHGTATTDALTARSSEGQSRVEFVLDPDESVEHHRTGLVQVELVVLHSGLLARLVRVPAVDLEGLHVGLLGGVGLDGLSRFDGRVRTSKGGGPEQRPRRSEQSRCGAKGSHGEDDTGAKSSIQKTQKCGVERRRPVELVDTKITTITDGDKMKSRSPVTNLGFGHRQKVESAEINQSERS